MTISSATLLRVQTSARKIEAMYAKADQLALDILRHPDATPGMLADVRAIQMRMAAPRRELRQNTMELERKFYLR